MRQPVQIEELCNVFTPCKTGYRPGHPDWGDWWREWRWGGGVELAESLRRGTEWLMLFCLHPRHIKKPPWDLGSLWNSDTDVEFPLFLSLFLSSSLSLSFYLSLSLSAADITPMLNTHSSFLSYSSSVSRTPFLSFGVCPFLFPFPSRFSSSASPSPSPPLHFNSFQCFHGGVNTSHSMKKQQSEWIQYIQKQIRHMLSFFHSLSSPTASFGFSAFPFMSLGPACLCDATYI